MTETTQTPSLRELVEDLQSQVDTLEARAAKARADYPQAAIKAKLAATETERTELQQRATELQRVLIDCKAQAEGIKPLLAEARQRLKEEDAEAAQQRYQDRLRATLQDADTTLQQRRALAAKAEKLLGDLAETMSKINQMGASAHWNLSRLMSTDQAHACTPNHRVLASSLFGTLIRQGATDYEALAQFTPFGMSNLQNMPGLTALVEQENLLMLSRFDGVVVDLNLARNGRRQSKEAA